MNLRAVLLLAASGMLMCSCGANRTTDASECFHATFAATGTAFDLNYEHTFESTSILKTTDSMTVQGQTTFDERATLHASGVEWLGDDPRPYDKQIYYRVNQDELIQSELGFERFATRGDGTYHRTVTYRPALERKFDLTVGESYSQFYSIDDNATYDSSNTGRETLHTQTDVVHVRQFDGLEVLTVPAGTFKTCKFSDRLTYTDQISDFTAAATEWNDIRTGVLIRREYEEPYASMQTTILLSGSIDGQIID